MYSIDALEKFYRDSRFNSGYMANGIIEEINCGRHQFFYGYFPEYVEEIGEGIDFVMLDTMHILPGELLDFLAMLPYLKDGAVVCIHDISLNQRIRGFDLSVATNVLYSSVVAQKLLEFDTEKIIGLDYPNIGMFIVNDDTRKYIKNIFLACVLSWSYMPIARVMKLYFDLLNKSYNAEEMRIFKSAYIMNLVRMYALPEERLHKGARIAVYGAGNLGLSYVVQIQNAKKYELVYWIDKNAEKLESLIDVKPCKLQKIQSHDVDFVVIAVNDINVRQEIYDDLLVNGFEKTQIVYEGMGSEERIY